MKEWRKAHGFEGNKRLRWARSYLSVYLRRKKLKKGPCSMADSSCRGSVVPVWMNLEMPLEVQWVCKGHKVVLDAQKKNEYGF